VSVELRSSRTPLAVVEAAVHGSDSCWLASFPFHLLQEASQSAAAAQPAADGGKQMRSRFQRFIKLEDDPSEPSALVLAASAAPPAALAATTADASAPAAASPPGPSTSPFAAVASGPLTQPQGFGPPPPQQHQQQQQQQQQQQGSSVPVATSPFAALAQAPAPQLTASSSLEQLLAGTWCDCLH